MHQTIHAILFDLDGVLYVGEEMIPSADRVIRELRRRKIPLATPAAPLVPSCGGGCGCGR